MIFIIDFCVIFVYNAFQNTNYYKKNIVMEKLLLLCILLIVAMFIWAKNHSDEKAEKIYEHDGSGLYDFVPKHHLPRGWYGYFYDGTVEKYGVIEGLSKDALEPFKKIRVFTSEMKDGVWDLLPIDFANDFPENAVVLTYEDRSGWHCSYPGDGGLAFAATISQVPAGILPGTAVKAEKIGKDEFKFVSSL